VSLRDESIRAKAAPPTQSPEPERSDRSRSAATGAGAQRSRLAILLYHRVAVPEVDPFALCVTPEHFAQQMAYLRRHTRIVRLGEACAALAEGRPLPDGVIVTFDDGYVDNVHRALPILARWQVPATVFVATGPVRTQHIFWWDEFATLCTGRERFWETYRQLRALPEAEREAVMERFRGRRAGEAPTWLRECRAMTEGELQRLCESPWIEIGAHTVTHPVLADLTPEAMGGEMRKSRATLEHLLDRPIRTLSYPYGGGTEVGPMAPAVARELGFVAACTSEARPLTPETDRHALPRLVVENWSGVEFRRRLQGFFGS
jgi:peptidoglycan/xylan/chitin deacetylase (PgdA/CDA1 family)